MEFAFRACDRFNKNKERILKFKETGNSRYLYQEELDKACLQHNTAYVNSKNLPKRTPSDKALCYKVFNVDKNPKKGGAIKTLSQISNYQMN